MTGSEALDSLSSVWGLWGATVTPAGNRPVQRAEAAIAARPEIAVRVPTIPESFRGHISLPAATDTNQAMVIRPHTNES